MSDPRRERDRKREADRFAALGLERDPFPEVDLHVDCFAEGARERHLEALANLRGLGRPLLLVTGPEGVGRTTFFHALLRRLPDDVPVVRVTAGVFLSARNLLQAVARAMGLATDPEEGRAALRERLEQEIFELGRSQVFCAALVDDADELEAEALEELISLAELSLAAGGVRVILFGGPTLRRVLVDVAGDEHIDFLAHEVRLEPYTLNELRSYLGFRLARAGHRGPSPFTEQDFQEIYRESGGLPRRANGVARRLLLAGHRGWSLPVAVPGLIAGAAAGAAVLTISLLWLLGSSGDEPSGRVTSAPMVLVDEWLPLPDPTESPTLPEGEAPPAQAPEVVPVPSDGAAPRGSVAAVSTQAAETSAARKADARVPAAVSGRQILLGRSAERFVLQLLGTSSRSNGEAWIAAQADAERFLLVERQRDGEPWFVVFYGDYVERSAALADQAAVASATGASPWARSVRAVQAELREE